MPVYGEKKHSQSCQAQAPSSPWHAAHPGLNNTGPDLPPQLCFLSSIRSAVLGFALFSCLIAFCHRKASNLRRKAKGMQSTTPSGLPKCQEFILYRSSAPLLLLYLLDRCFLPARWAVSMARVSSTGRCGQIAQAKLGKREGNDKAVCVPEPAVGVFLLE